VIVARKTVRPRLLFCITVYNGVDVVPASLRSAGNIASASAEVDFLVLDDASPEEGFSDKVRELCADLGFQYYRSPRNLGIPRNVNVGLLRALDAGYDHVVIANSDVVFSAGLVNQMVKVAESDESIGSVTAWSNNASIYSLPNDDPDANLATQDVVDRIAASLVQEFGIAAVDVPAGISFCILIPTRVLRVVGLMDPVFGRGYCEETDWSLRSKELGYRITLSPSSFAYHRGQGSTSGTEILPAGLTTVPANERIIDLRYPLFRSQVEAFCSSEIRDLLWNSAYRRILLDAEREDGYEIDLGWPRPSDDEGRGPRVTFEAIGGSLVPVGRYKGFRMELPTPGPDGDPIQAVVEFFGSKPRAARLADHNRVTHEIAASLRDLGVGVDSTVGYPYRV
jgi:GT2 family glycosyltransferase